MVSFAAPGGSVGPHKDNYDVFLCQGEGIREWHLGDRDSVAEDPSQNELPLLKPFLDQKPKSATDGDVLYLPPGIPHWGIAKDFCMTYSIGMRAPNLAELNTGAARLFGELDDATAKSSATGSDIFYEDPDLTTDEAVAGLISGAAIRRAQEMLHKSISLDARQIARILGSVATDPKAWLAPECASDDEAQKIISDSHRDVDLPVHGMARIAYCEGGETGLVFANGIAMAVSTGGIELFQNICEVRGATLDNLCAEDHIELVHWMLTSGVFDMTAKNE